MRIRRLQIDGFGHFSGCEVGPFDRPLTVIFGPNEAGKSTLLAFIRTILFGFPPRGRSQFYPPLAGGRHGGRIELADENGTHYTVERLSGAGGGDVCVTSNREQVRNEALLRNLLGQSSSAMFKTVFAFGLDELQSLDSLNASDVSGRIYSAGMGAAGLPEAIKALEGARDKVFKNRGSKQEVAEALAELQRVDVALDRVKGDAAEYKRLVSRGETLVLELESVAAQVSRLSIRRSELGRLREGWPDWVKLNELDERLRELPSREGFPADAIARLDAAIDRVRREELQLVTAKGALSSAREEAAAPVPDEELLESAEQVEYIRRNQGRFDSLVADLPKRQAERARQEADLRAALRELGSGWDERRLEGFDVSLPVRTALEKWRDDLAERERTVRDAESDARRAERSLGDARERTGEARREVEATERPPLDAAGLGRRRAVARDARSRLADYRLVQQRREDLEKDQAETQQGTEREESQPWRKAWIPVVGLGLLAMVGGLRRGGDVASFAVFVGAALLAAAVYLFVAGRKPRARVGASQADVLRRRLAQARQDEVRARSALERSAEPLGAGCPDSARLDQVEADLDQTAAAIERWDQADKVLGEARKEEERWKRRTAGTGEAARAAEDDLRATREGWTRWLAERGFNDTTLAPAAVTAIISRVEKAGLQFKSLADARQRVKAIEGDVAQYSSRVVPLAKRIGIEVSADQARSVTTAADKLTTRLDEVRESLRNREQAKRCAEGAAQECQSREGLVRKAQADMEALLREAGTQDLEEFRRMAADHEERRTLEQERRVCARGLRQLCGPEEAFSRFCETWKETDPISLEEGEKEVVAELSVAEEKREMLLQEQGSVRTEIDRLAGEDEASSLRARRAVFVEQLRNHAREWSVLTIALSLLDQARSKYEEERQPGVLKSAQGFFKAVTGGAYERLHSPLGSQTISVVAANGEAKTPDMLSRGTREQLYLALRFGLIRQFGEQETSLPAVVDEVLVNFDPERARRAAEGFVELARTNQVLVFTCHPAIVDLFIQVEPASGVIELGRLERHGGTKSREVHA